MTHTLEVALKGDEVVIAHDGVQALRAVQMERPDLVILGPALAWLGRRLVRWGTRLHARYDEAWDESVKRMKEQQ